VKHFELPTRELPTCPYCRAPNPVFRPNCFFKTNPLTDRTDFEICTSCTRPLIEGTVLATHAVRPYTFSGNLQIDKLMGDYTDSVSACHAYNANIHDLDQLLHDSNFNQLMRLSADAWMALSLAMDKVIAEAARAAIDAAKLASKPSRRGKRARTPRLRSR